jgi:hypothetical protein
VEAFPGEARVVDPCEVRVAENVSAMGTLQDDATLAYAPSRLANNLFPGPSDIKVYVDKENTTKCAPFMAAAHEGKFAISGPTGANAATEMAPPVPLLLPQPSVCAPIGALSRDRIHGGETYTR